MCYQTRKDSLTAGKIEVALVYREMLSTAEAEEYLAKEGVSNETISRILFTDQQRGRRERTNREEAWSPENFPCRRKNYLHKAFIEAALKIDCDLGRSRAQKILLNESISEIVIDRVLADGPRQVRAIPKRPVENIEF
jgi:hypothetical protein